MKKLVPILIIVVVIVGVGVFFATKKNNNSNNAYSSNSSSTSSNMPNPSPSSSSQSPQATDKVTISNYNFSPGAITVKKGTAVTWTNQDSVAHNVQETDGKSGPMSGDLDNGKSYTFTFNTPGTYNYHCSIHPEMVGKVVVTG